MNSRPSHDTPDRDEPLRWHWLYIPLVAYLVFSIAPSILAPIFFVVTLFIIDVPMQPAPTPVSLVAFPLFPWPYILAISLDVSLRSERIDRTPVF